MDVEADLYERDFFLWTQAQAARLRAAAEARVNAPIDWEHVAEEIESLGRRDRRELRSRLTTIAEHLLKLRWSAAREPRRTWIATVTRERDEVAAILQDSPSLRPDLPALCAKASAVAAPQVTADLLSRGEIDDDDAESLTAARLTEAAILDDPLPE